MRTNDFINYLKKFNVGFYTGVPDSLLSSFSAYLMNDPQLKNNHIIAANEGNAVALAVGYHLATNRIPCIYLQNSGLGNIVNPVASLLNDKVYAIPSVFVVGWRGEPGVMDEPQHVFQGEITLKMLEDIAIKPYIIEKPTSMKDLDDIYDEARSILFSGRSIAFVVKKKALESDSKFSFENKFATLREEIIDMIVDASGDDLIISTTGKTSRELFEIREKKSQDHNRDFLTVGSMGHSSSIALGIALNCAEKTVWCIDGDGAMLMHMGSLALVGAYGPNNFIHVLINNEAHESVGGQPTVASSIDFAKIADGCGYKYISCVETLSDLKSELDIVSSKNGPVFIEIKAKIGSRTDLGRPTTSAIDNKRNFMKFITEDKK